MFEGLKKNLSGMLGGEKAKPPVDETEQPAQTLSPDDQTPDDNNINVEGVKQSIIKVLKTVYDPEIPVNIYDLGLVYDINVDSDGTVVVKMTLTSPNCPMADMILQEVYYKTTNAPGVSSGRVDLVWEPPWDPSSMSDAAKLELNML